MKARGASLGRGSMLKPDGGIMTSDEWCTPPEIARPLYDFWGPADLDPCSNERSIIVADEAWTVGGLVRPWKPQTWQNHPYSQNAEWIAKAVHEMAVGNVVELVILCMTSTSTVWWQRAMLEPERNPRVICTKRIPFLGPDGTKRESSRFDPSLIYYGSRHDKFDRSFDHVRRWATWGR